MAKAFIMVQNRGEMPVWGIRLLGRSNKSDDKIGRFGTGLKESIALCVRMGIELVVYSGTRRVDFSTRTLDGQEEICFMLSESTERFTQHEWHGLGMHPNFGHHDWAEPWMILREIVCNAVDESDVEYLHREVTSDAPSGVAGSTRIYIEATSDMLQAYGSLSSRLRFLGESRHAEVHRNEESVVLTKDRHEDVQIFHRGVWTQTRSSLSLFDYQLDQVRLNESRSVDWGDVDQKIGELLCDFSADCALRFLDHVVRQRKSCYESTNAIFWSKIYAGAGDGGWVEAWQRLFGPDHVMCGNSKRDVDTLERCGKHPVVVTSTDVYEFLRKLGIPTILDAVSETDREILRERQPSGEESGRMHAVWCRFEEAGLTDGEHRPIYRICQFSDDSIMGRYRDGVVYVAERFVGCEEEYAILVEEISHYISGAADETRPFQNYLVRCIVAFAGEPVL